MSRPTPKPVEMWTFSGPTSKPFWDAVNASDAGAAGGILYVGGCLAQEMEAEIKRLTKNIEYIYRLLEESREKRRELQAELEEAKLEMMELKSDGEILKCRFQEPTELKPRKMDADEVVECKTESREWGNAIMIGGDYCSECGFEGGHYPGCNQDRNETEDE